MDAIYYIEYYGSRGKPTTRTNQADSRARGTRDALQRIDGQDWNPTGSGRSGSTRTNQPTEGNFVAESILPTDVMRRPGSAQWGTSTPLVWISQDGVMGGLARMVDR